MPPRARRARRKAKEEAAQPPTLVETGAPAPLVPQYGTPEWDKAHLQYLQDELNKYEASNPEAATRLRARIKEHRAKLKQ